MNKNEKPEIRYSEFADEWEQRKVSEITSSYSGGTPKSGTAEYYDGDIPFIRSGEIYNDSTELFITELGMNNSSAKMVHVGDILYALYGATSGEVSRAKLDGAINQAILALIPNKEINADFLVEWFRKEKDKITDTYLQGGQGNLSAQIIKELELQIPSTEEQNIIGAYFEQLNNLITLHQRKLEKMKKVKEAMLIKLFPQGDSDVPEIRFKGFEGTWVTRRLCDICERITRKNKNGESNLPLTIASQYGLIDQRDFFNGIVAAKDMTGYYLLKRGEFAYNKSFSKGYDYGSIKRLNAYDQGCLSSLYICFGLSTDEVDSDYLECYFDTLRWYADVSLICAEGARNHGLLNVDTSEFFTEVHICVPSNINEQIKIAEYLKNLNELITQYQHKCDSLCNIKKALLSKMFV